MKWREFLGALAVAGSRTAEAERLRNLEVNREFVSRQHLGEFGRICSLQKASSPIFVFQHPTIPTRSHFSGR
jgi:hypothetical protein